MNQSEIKTYARLTKTCLETCKLRACDYQVWTTLNLDHFETDTLVMWFLLPIWPISRIEHRPLFGLNDYIIYVMSCLGTWLGLSVIAMNPVKLFDKHSAENTSSSYRSRSRVYSRLWELELKYRRMTQQQDLMKMNINQLKSANLSKSV